MAAPLWVKDYLSRHNIDGTVSEAVNSAVAARADDPFSHIARHMAQRAARAGCISKVQAHPVISSSAASALRITVRAHVDGFEQSVAAVVAGTGRASSDTRPVDQALDKAVVCAQTIVNKKLTGMVASNTAQIDECLMSLDPSRTVASIGANVIHATSIACCRAAARAGHEQLYSVVARRFEALAHDHIKRQTDGTCDLPQHELPTDARSQVDESVAQSPPAPYPVQTLGKFFTPVAIAEAAVDALEDGAAAAMWLRGISFCSGCDVPAAASAAHISSVFAKFRAKALSSGWLAPSVGCSAVAEIGGGSATVEAALDAAAAAIAEAGVKERAEVGVGVDLAADRLYDRESKTYTVGESKMEQDDWVKFVAELCKARPCISVLVDAAATGDYEAWLKLKAAVPSHVTLLGQRLYDSDMDLLKQGVQEKWSHACAISICRLPTVSLCAAASLACQNDQLRFVAAAEGEDAIDIAVGTKAWGVLMPPPLHGHNTSVWNRWVDVDEEVRRLDVWLPNPLSPAVAVEAAVEAAPAAAPAKKK